MDGRMTFGKDAGETGPVILTGLKYLSKG